MPIYLGTVDDLFPEIAKPPLQDYDNYQIYSLIWFDYEYLSTAKLSQQRITYDTPGQYLPFHPVPQQVSGNADDAFRRVYNLGYKFSQESSSVGTQTNSSGLIAYQKYSIDSIPFDFADVANKIKIQPRNSYVWKRLDSSTPTNPILNDWVDEYSRPDISDYYQNLISNNGSIGNNQFRLNFLSTQDIIYYRSYPSETITRRTTSHVTIEDIYTVIEDSNIYPDIFSLIDGYSQDSRIRPSNYPSITPTESGVLSISYYRKNDLEQIPDVTSLDWLTYKINLTSGQSIKLPLSNPVFGTLLLDGNSLIVNDVQTQLSLLSNASNKYKWSDYYFSSIDNVVNQWTSLYSAMPSSIPAPSTDFQSLLGYRYLEYSSIPQLKVLSANNNIWNNQNISTDNINVTQSDLDRISVNANKAYLWHRKQQENNSYGSLIMDGIRTIETRAMVEQLLIALNAVEYQVEDTAASPPQHKLDWYIKNQTIPPNLKVDQIHRALNAAQYQNETPAIVGTGTIDNPETPATHKLDWYIKNSAGEKVTAIWKALGGDKYSKNSIDNTKERVTNLGFLVERIAKVLGIRFDDNGKIDVGNEKSIVRKVLDSTSGEVDEKLVGVNNFGDEGMIVRRINNRFDRTSKDTKIVSDQCVIVQDIPDMIQEYFEQSNLALGLQESSAIEIKQGDKNGSKARFNNQLELLIELVTLMSAGNEMTRAALVSSLVTQSQTNELIAGLGLPSVTKTIPIKIGEKVTQLPFKGIAAHRSISQEIATCTYNVGIATGQLL